MLPHASPGDFEWIYVMRLGEGVERDMGKEKNP